jgi:two-component system, NtrC family, sensor histidine kinase PilS
MIQKQNNQSAFTETNWQALQYFNLYRILISLLFIGLTWIGQLPEPLGLYDKKLFSLVVHAYLVISVIISFSIHLKVPRYMIQVASHVFIDIVAISIMLYASNGLGSGFGMLMVIAVAGGSLLCARRIAILFAAIATLFILGHEVYIQLFRYFPSPNYTHAGFLGVTFFVVAILGHLLAARVEESKALVKQHVVDLESLAKLNEFIVQRMQAGIIVLDEQLRIRLANESARLLLGLPDNALNRLVNEVSPELDLKLRSWLHQKGNRIDNINLPESHSDIQVSFTQLKPDTKFGILVFLEDIALMRQRAQHLKLASLGRLAASIAHEVRNPLGAITHASQLLSETGMLDEESNRLKQIILDHSHRVNTIIENVQHISKREPATPELITISQWIKEFINEFSTSKKLSMESIRLSLDSDDIMVRMDPSQLYQVMWNLSENAVYYSTGKIKLEYVCGVRKDSKRAYIDVIDHGPGININIVDHLFEPFFTTNTKGTGLGLYIARELCEANQVSLSLYNNSEKGCCFRINFPHSDRQQDYIQ